MFSVQESGRLLHHGLRARRHPSARASGKFYDLLVATAQSPAMLMYLDNWLSIGPHSEAAGKNGQNGLNENYAREVMELHTLGVDGGYTQADVTELARSADRLDHRAAGRRRPVSIRSAASRAGQQDRSRRNILRHRERRRRCAPWTCWRTILPRRISSPRCIATRFVSDDPPESLVARMAAKFLSSDGDIREVLRTMLHSPEFWSPDAYRAKFKTPLEFVVSAVRASGANVVAPGCAGAKPDGHGHAAVRHGPSHGLFHEGGDLGEYRRGAGAHQFFDCADAGKARRRAIRSRGPAGAGHSRQPRLLRG